MSRNPYQRNNVNRHQQQPPPQSRPIVNPYASRNNNNRNGNVSNNNGSGRSALSLMPGPLHTASPHGTIQAPPDMTINTATTAANPANINSTTNSSNPYSDVNENNNDHNYNDYGSYNDVDRIGNTGQNDFGNDMDAVNSDVNTSYQQHTHASDTNSKATNDANKQIQDLQEQLKALRQELTEQSESNFDLNATIATMQAEMDHTLQTSRQKHKEEASKLQHLLRLEQQKSRRLESQHQQRTQQENNMPLRKRPPSQSVFTKRLEAQAGMTATAPAIPQNISLPTTTNESNPTLNTASISQAPKTPPRKSSNDPQPTFSITKQKAKTTHTNSSPSPIPIQGATKTIEPKSTASRLAQHILQSIMDSSSRSTENRAVDTDEARTVEQTNAQPTDKGDNNHKKSDEDDDTEMVITDADIPQEEPQHRHHHHYQAQRVLLDIASDGQAWSEVQLVEYVLRQEDAWEIWYPALEKSRLGRRQLLQAIEKRHKEMQNPMAECEKEDSMEPTIQKRSRITRLGQAGGRTRLDASLETDILNSLMDPWWDPSSMASIQANVAARLQEPSKTEAVDTKLSPSVAYTWIQKLVQECITHNDVQFQALRVLHTVLEESNDAHDQVALWEVCRQPMEQALEGLYRKWMFEMAKLIQEEKNANHPNSIRMSKNSKKKEKIRKRRIEATPVEELSMESSDIGDIERNLAISLSIWRALVLTTKIEKLDLWFVEQKGARMVSIVLDMLEEHEHLYDTRNRPRNPAYYAIKGWYMDTIHFLSTVGTSKSGIDVLRTRTHPANVTSPDSYWMGNTLDVAIRQLFSLVMDQEQDARKKLDREQHMRTLAIEGWVRLWHQVLLFVQDQQLPDKQPVALTFRSLVLEHQNWYTSACAMLLADQEGTRQDIQTMIRLQLEELSMDEEEYEELRGN